MQLRPVIRLSLIVTVFLVAVTIWELSRPAKNDQDPALAFIESKVSARPVYEGLTPVLIFQYNDTRVVTIGNAERIDSFLAGSGTLVKLSSGKSYVITAEHIFTTYKKGNYEDPKYAVKELQSKSKFAMGSLVSANPFFIGKTGFVDIAVCEVGSDRNISIKPFSSYQGADGTSENHPEHNLCVGDPKDKVLWSLVSGQEVRLLCMEKIPNVRDFYYYIINYKSVAGESGEGFVDRFGRLYILKGTINEVGSVNKELRKMGVIDKDNDGYSIVIGSITIKK